MKEYTDISGHLTRRQFPVKRVDNNFLTLDDGMKECYSSREGMADYQITYPTERLWDAQIQTFLMTKKDKDAFPVL